VFLAEGAGVPLVSSLFVDVTPSVSSHINVGFLRSDATDEDLPRLANGLDADNEARRGAPVALETDTRLRATLDSRPGSAMLGVRSRPRPTPTLTDGEGDIIRESSWEAMAASMFRLGRALK